MALRNYLYAKHDSHVEINTRINKAEISDQDSSTTRMSSSSPSTSSTSSSTIKPTGHGRSIPRNARHHHATLVSQQVNKVAHDLDEVSIDGGKKCTKSCESCKCEKEKEKGGGDDSVGHHHHHHDDEPSLKVEVAENEVDFTNVL
ncbi:hypothetical protein I9W82_004171 [Candida metapsilosis]|uniref:Uncharacterized protein n=1 Tax=Candida metapsilosis TaxID=273372 RepID=A0A8H8D9X3_9ASCO|nr:hypothetical protein I9W82_004171 [Candida metapsilosis]